MPAQSVPAPDRDKSHTPAGARTVHTSRWILTLARSTDSYGLVLQLIFLDYIAGSVLADTGWGRVVIVLLLGVTLLLTLHTSRARRGLLLLGWVFVSLNLVFAIGSALFPQNTRPSFTGLAIGGFLLIAAPIVILRRIATHRVVTVETILGAINVYLLFGMIFALLCMGVGALGSAPFFAGVPHATSNDYLFFSYTTLTTVGYGDLVPAGNLGRTLAMVEALMGQIYLVIVVARLVSLWGQRRPRSDDSGREQQEP